jgi:methylated-DNA-[protein]-cysteine S-methyltransferase
MMLSDRFDSPVGPIRLVVRDSKLVQLSFDDGSKWSERNLASRFPGESVGESRDPSGFSGRLRAYFEGEHSAIEAIPTDAEGSPFEMQVWDALKSIPCGATASYGEIAERLGDKGAARAVGIANNRNPIAIVVPCHRVIGADGTLVGYGGGLDRKIWLLRHEGVPVHNGRIDRQGDLFD